MFRLTLTLLFTLLLTTLCGFSAAPAVAQPTVIQVVAEVSSGESMFSFAGKRPTNLGVKDGQLAACPTSPNCVNSQSPATDPEHQIEPLTYSSSPEQAIANLKSVIQGIERTKIVEAGDRYLYAEFTSALMGFVDDVEFYCEPDTGLIQVRSASRLGQSDLGVNRKRIEAIRAKLAEI